MPGLCMRRLGLGLGFGWAADASPPPAPTALFLSNDEVEEAAANGTVIGYLLAVGGTPPYSYSLSSNPGNRLSIVGNELRVAAAFTGLTSHAFEVTVTDAEDQTLAQPFTLTVVPAIDNDSGIEPDDGAIVAPDPEDPETDQGGFETPPAQQSTSEGLKIAGKNGGSATWFKSLALPEAGSSITFAYQADWSGMSRLGREAAVGFAFKAGNQYHLSGVRGDGANPAAMLASRVHGDFRKANQFTVTDDGAAAGATKDGPNYLRLAVSTDGETYSVSAGSSIETLAEVQTGRVPTPMAGVDDALEFGIGGYFTNQDKGVFQLTITLFEVQEIIYVAPTLVAVGTSASALSAGVTPGLPAGWAQNDILIAYFVCRADDNAAAPSGYAEGASSPQSVGPGASSQAIKMHWFWKRAGASESAPAFASAGSLNFAVMIAVRGCPVAESPFDAVAGATQSNTASVSLPAVTTTIENELIVQCAARNIDNLGAAFSAWANANLASLTERYDNGTSASTGGGAGIATGVAAAPGNIGNTTATVSSAAYLAEITIALKGVPEVYIAGAPVTSATDGTAYTGFTVIASGGTPPYAYSLVGDWPAGLSINSSSGAVSGTPTEHGSFPGLSVRVTDANGETADLATFAIEVAVDPDAVWIPLGDMTAIITSDGNSPSIADVPIGAEHPDRWVLISVAWSKYASGLHTIDSMTLGGVPGTRVRRGLNSTGTANAEHWLFRLGGVSGTTATLSFVKGGGVAEPDWALQIVPAYYASDTQIPLLLESAGNGETTAAATLSATQAGQWVVHFGHRSNSGTPTFTSNPAFAVDYHREINAVSGFLLLESVYGINVIDAALTVTMSSYVTDTQAIVGSLWSEQAAFWRADVAALKSATFIRPAQASVSKLQAAAFIRPNQAQASVAAVKTAIFVKPV